MTTHGVRRGEYPADDADRDDMAALVTGEDEALNRLMERHAAHTFRFLYHLVGNEADASELAQETFARVYLQRATYRQDQIFVRWLYAIAANLGRNLLRSRSRRREVSLERESEHRERPIHETIPGATRTPDEDLAATEKVTAVRSAIDRLPVEMRETLVLCDLQDRPVAEVAALLNIPLRTVDSRLYRARQILRNRLGGLYSGRPLEPARS